MDRKERILQEVEGLVSDLYFYSRKEDEDLPLGSIEEAILEDDLMLDLITETFRTHLVRGL